MKPSPALLVLLACASLGGCAARQEVPLARERRHRSGLPDAEVVTSAVRGLGEAARERLLPWPPHLPRSRDFPQLPLVRVEEVEDLGRTGADVDALTRALEHELRRQRLLRLSVDEEAVPAWLREGSGDGVDDAGDRGAAPPRPGAPAADRVAAPPLRDGARGDPVGRVPASDEPASDEPASDEPVKPGLSLRAWTDRAGRLRLELQDLVTGKRLTRVRSR